MTDERFDARSWLVPLRGADPDATPSDDLSLYDLGRPGGPSPVLETRPERTVLLAFSAIATVRRWRASSRFVTAPAPDVVALGRRLGAGAVELDPAGPSPRTIPLESDAIPASADPWKVRALAGPLDPRALFRIRSRFEAHPAIQQVYIVEATVDGRDVLIAGFELPSFDPDAGAATVRAVTREVLPLLPAGLYAGVQSVVLSDEDFSASVRTADRPIYERTAFPDRS